MSDLIGKPGTIEVMSTTNHHAGSERREVFVKPTLYKSGYMQSEL